jgi:hypothetical protein
MQAVGSLEDKNWLMESYLRLIYKISSEWLCKHQSLIFY